MFAELISLQFLIRIAGLGQLALVAASPAIPHVLHWRSELASVSVLTRRLFWVYAGYILSINLAFGLVSTLAPHWLLDASPLSAAVCGSVALYWGARLAVQFACFGRIEKPKGRKFLLAEFALVSLFVGLTIIYGAAFVSRWWNFTG